MDLHDYTDVAENYDLYLDEMYKNEDNPYQKNRKGADAAALVGANFDAGV